MSITKKFCILIAVSTCILGTRSVHSLEISSLRERSESRNDVGQEAIQELSYVPPRQAQWPVASPTNKIKFNAIACDQVSAFLIAIL